MSDVKTYNKPDFLCVGLHKCGTTWLNKQLKLHPEISMPVIKELRFFLEGDIIPRFSILRLIFSHHNHFRSMRTKAIKRFFPNGKLRKKDLNKMWRYYTHNHTLDWYFNNFDQHKISGDVTPGYFLVSDQQILRIKKHFPDIKIIIMLRDPVNRLWSNLKMNHSGGKLNKDLNSLSVNDISVKKLLESSQDYVEIIQRWQKHFERVGVFYYDRIPSEPEALMKDIYSFLGCKNTEFKDPRIRKVLNPGKKIMMPSQLKLDLNKTLLPEVQKLVDYTDHLIPKQWLADYHAFLEKNP